MYYFLGIVLIGVIAWLLLKEKPWGFNLVSKQEARLKRGLEYLKKNQAITNEQYREMVGITRRQAIRDMDLLEKQGLVEQIGQAGKDVKYRLKS
ncbi:MAG: hypothetical protein KJ879_01990 [Nanoarchaeota archaeon]|nr:hypothetical protein [Nanoarchaeota archaeon]